MKEKEEEGDGAPSFEGMGTRGERVKMGEDIRNDSDALGPRSAMFARRTALGIATTTMTTTTEEEDIRDLFNIIYAGEDWDVSA